MPSPWVQRMLREEGPARDATSAVAVPGGECSFCGAEFVSAQARNVHVMRRHADRRDITKGW